MAKWPRSGRLPYRRPVSDDAKEADTDGIASVGLDPEWIAANVVIDGVRPQRAEFAGFIGTGQMSRTARFVLHWGTGPDADAAPSDRPTSVVVKVPSAQPTTRALSFEHGVYQRECEFYRSLLPLVDVAAPTALVVHVDEAAPDFALVLEDLTGSEQGDQFTEPTHEQLLLAVDQAAALHAPVWGKTGEPAFARYRKSTAEVAANAAIGIGAALGPVFDRLGAGLDEGVADALEQFASVAGVWAASSAPTTLVHGDFRPDNFMFGVRAGAPPLVVVDWQTLTLGHGATDIAYLLGAAVTPERRRSIEDDMLARYCDELARRGVDHHSSECCDHYALGSLHGVAIAVRATSMADQTERGDALFTMMINRHIRHAVDVGILDRLASGDASNSRW